MSGEGKTRAADSVSPPTLQKGRVHIKYSFVSPANQVGVDEAVGPRGFKKTDGHVGVKKCLLGLTSDPTSATTKTHTQNGNFNAREGDRRNYRD